jgi:hypothetical protein
MWLEAILLKEDLSAVLDELLPVTLRIGDDGTLLIEEPSEVSLVEGVGLRVVCKAKLHWSVLGISVPVSLRSLDVVLRPQIVERADGPALVFKVELEHADLRGVPTIIDNRVTELVNRELAAKHVELSWNYAATLNHVFKLPDALQPLLRLQLTVVDAQVRSTKEALGLAIQIRTTVKRGEDGAPHPR